jgi:hypothetical protein
MVRNIVDNRRFAGNGEELVMWLSKLAGLYFPDSVLCSTFLHHLQVARNWSTGTFTMTELSIKSWTNRTSFLPAPGFFAEPFANCEWQLQLHRTFTAHYRRRQLTPVLTREQCSIAQVVTCVALAAVMCR